MPQSTVLTAPDERLTSPFPLTDRECKGKEGSLTSGVIVCLRGRDCRQAHSRIGPLKWLSNQAVGENNEKWLCEELRGRERGDCWSVSRALMQHPVFATLNYLSWLVTIRRAAQLTPDASRTCSCTILSTFYSILLSILLFPHYSHALLTLACSHLEIIMQRNE